MKRHSVIRLLIGFCVWHILISIGFDQGKIAGRTALFETFLLSRPPAEGIGRAWWPRLWRGYRSEAQPWKARPRGTKGRPKNFVGKAITPSFGSLPECDFYGWPGFQKKTTAKKQVSVECGSIIPFSKAWVWRSDFPRKLTCYTWGDFLQLRPT
jgi:hypothetical protein